MRDSCRNYQPLWILAGGILLFAALLIALRAQANSGTYALRTIAGDASALDRLRLEFLITGNGYQQEITIENGELSHRFVNRPMRAQEAIVMDHYPVAGQNFFEAEGAHVETEIETHLYFEDERQREYETNMIRKADRIGISLYVYQTQSNSRRVNEARVVTGLYIEPAEPVSFVWRSYTTYEGKNPLNENFEPDPSYQPDVEPFSSVMTEEGWAQFEQYESAPAALFALDGDTIYVTPAVQPYHQGMSSIYRFDGWNVETNIPHYVRDGYEFYLAYEQMEYGEMTELARFAAKETRTLHLAIVEGKICLLTAEGGALVLRVYDLSGVPLSETVLLREEEYPKLRQLTCPNAGALNSSGQSYGCTFSENMDETILNYELYTEEERAEEALNGEWLLLAVKLSGEPEVESMQQQPYQAVQYASLLDEKMVVYEKRSEKQIGGYNMTADYIHIYTKDGEPLYIGKLFTDVNEDQIGYYPFYLNLHVGHINAYYPDAPLRVLYCTGMEEVD